jgi:hypothetical protein
MKLHSVYRGWSDQFDWGDERFPSHIFDQMGVYEGLERRNEIRESLRFFSDVTGLQWDRLVRVLLSRFARENREVFDDRGEG